MLSYQSQEDEQENVRDNLLKLLNAVKTNPSTESLNESKERFKYAEIPTHKHTVPVAGRTFQVYLLEIGL